MNLEQKKIHFDLRFILTYNTYPAILKVEKALGPRLTVYFVGFVVTYGDFSCFCLD